MIYDSFQILLLLLQRNRINLKKKTHAIESPFRQFHDNS